MARNRKIRATARQRLIAVLVLLGLLPLSILTVSSLVLSQRAVDAEVDANITASGNTFAGFVRGSITNLSVAVDNFAASPDLQGGAGGQRVATVQRTLSTMLASRPDLSALLLTDPAGLTTAVAPFRKASIGFDTSHRDYYAGALAARGSYVSPAYQASVKANGRVVAIARRIETPAATGAPVTTGILVAVLNITSLQQATDQLVGVEHVNLYVVDQRGMLIAGPGQLKTDLTAAPDHVLADSSNHARSGVVTVHSKAGDLLSVSTPLPELGWTVVVQRPVKQALAGLVRLRQLVLGVAAVLMVGLFAAAWVMLNGERRRQRIELEAASHAQALAASERLFRAAFEHAPMGIARVNRDGLIIDANLALHQMLGLPDGELAGRAMVDVTHPDDLAGTEDFAARITRAGRSGRIEKRYLRSDGSVVWVLVSVTWITDADGSGYTLAQIVDISDRKAIELQLNQEATHDSLTGLPNRVLLEQKIDRALQGDPNDEAAGVALIFLDLDGFKEINDRLGHSAGDQVLVEIAARLQGAIRPADTVARIGGDEFVVLCQDVSGLAGEVAAQVADRLLEQVCQPGSFRGAPWQVSASIGISTPRVGSSGSRPGVDDQPCDVGALTGTVTSGASLIADADCAMYRAKQQGKGRIEVFEPGLHELSLNNSVSVAYLDSALSDERLVLHYQPVFDLESGQIVGAESLLRLLGPDGGLVQPAGFLASAEAHGQIVEFGEWSLRQACTQAAQWKAQLAPGADFAIAVNMSVKEIESSNFLTSVDAALAASGLPPGALVIELTESAFLRDLPASRSALEKLRDRGVKLALDDFGTGFSSLSYLRRFPVDIIKIDRSFVADLLTGIHGARVTRGLIALANTLEVVLVAEGVEEQAQRTELLRNGCRLAQGYLLARPLPAAEFSSLLLAAGRFATVGR